MKNAVAEVKQYASVPSYYPETKLKSEDERITENVEWAKKYGEPNKFYALYHLEGEIGIYPRLNAWSSQIKQLYDRNCLI